MADCTRDSGSKMLDMETGMKDILLEISIEDNLSTGKLTEEESMNGEMERSMMENG